MPIIITIAATVDMITLAAVGTSTKNSAINNTIKIAQPINVKIEYALISFSSLKNDTYIIAVC